MKNVKTFCEMAMHIRTVKECNMTVSNVFGDDDLEPCCFIGNIFRAGIGGFDKKQAYHLSRSNDDSEWTVQFGVQPHHHMLFPYRFNNAWEDIVSGEDYYDECVILLRDHKCLSVLRRMENQAKAA